MPRGDALEQGIIFFTAQRVCRIQMKDRYSYKDAYGGGSSSFTRSYKAGEFVDKSTGGLGYEQEANYTSTDKYVDKELGFTTEYQTQVKFKKSVYPNKTQVKFKKSGSPFKAAKLRLKSERSILLQAVDLRGRMVPPVPDNAV
ncbi:uncharacterized protein Pyn_09604 [Prunus yedoensis var. nudiflora]|uniref:Uncharacterized protein n=1 Tax=Prunus yedoensis var. nudiflora TaxID=2094558 RepID=A0A314XX63_PRUYE|nr:uncharacterized protein Pyn_09604 [Prunus yedoensis var. nudiflora]